jgi:hypothetical protein
MQNFNLKPQCSARLRGFKRRFMYLYLDHIYVGSDFICCNASKIGILRLFVRLPFEFDI